MMRIKQRRLIQFLFCLLFTGCGEETPLTDMPLDGRVSPDSTDSVVDQGDSALDGLVRPEDMGLLDEGLGGSEGGDMGDMQDGDLPACDPPLVLAPETVFVAAYDLVNFRASGGSGHYRFELSVNASDAIINEYTGAYLAGPIVGQRDVVHLTDTHCVGQAVAAVDVVYPLEVIPRDVTVPYGHRFQFEPSGGSGQYEYELTLAETGGNIDDNGVYTAGAEAGTDTIRVSDRATGLEADAQVTVARNPEMNAEPQRIFMAAGSQYDVIVNGGSGHFLIESDEEVAILDPETNRVMGMGPGTTEMRFTDRFSGLTSSVQVGVSDSLRAPLSRVGRSTRSTSVLGVGDLDGDGYNDAVIGFSEASMDRLADGAVAVYHGGENGLEPDPVQVLTGRSQEGYFGRSVAVGDINGDERIDLLVGAPLDDTGASNAGSVYVYLGEADGVFSEEPHSVIPGVRANDQLGHSVSVCDVNGDGFKDLLGGTPYTEVRSRDDALRDQGGVLVFLGGPEGISEAPTQLVDGFALNAEQEWAPRGGLRLGLALTTGDFDGDGLCDVAAGTTNWFAPEGRDSGMVQIFRGRLPNDDPEYPDPGGIDEQPSLIIVGDELGPDRSALGRRMTVADFNGDGMDDLVVAQHGYEGDAGNNAGAVRIFAGRPFEGPTERYTSATDAEWTFFGRGGNNNFGIALSAGDMDGDTVPDLLVGAWQGESSREGAERNTGVVIILSGQEGDWPETDPSEIDFGGLNVGDRFGSAVAHLGDTNGDGTSDFLAMASDNADLGVRVGRPYAVHGDQGIVPLELPGLAAGHVFGRSVAQIDLDGDGRTSILVSAPRQPQAPNSINSGEVFVYGDLTGSEDAPMPQSSIAQRPGLGGEDLFGIGIQSGDVTGDGQMDVVISSAYEEYTRAISGDHVLELGDCSNGRDSGATYVFSGASIAAGEPEATLAHFGLFAGANGRILAVSDINGDGHGDIVIGGPAHDNPTNSGLVEVALGRPAGEPGTVTFICDNALSIRGDQNSGNLGLAGADLGDIDGDGCDDFVVGEPRKRIGDQGDAGAAILFFGWGGPGCAATPRMTKFHAGRGEAQFGSAFATATGANGAAQTLFVGGPRHRRFDNNQRQGGVFIVQIDSLLALPRVGVEQENPPVHLLEQGTDFDVLESGDNESYFGAHVSYAGGVLGVGAPDGRPDGQTRAGWVRLFTAQNGSYQAVAEVVGDTSRPDAEFGQRLSLSAQPPRLLVGERNGSGNPAQGGSAYVFSLSDLMP